jgi:cytosine/adenosine deaminase-related metal-dependent hydrolase
VQDAPFKEIVALKNPLISVHLLESDDESQLYQHHGSLWEWYERMGWECDFLHYGSPARRIVESIPQNSPILLVHATRATEMDVTMIEEHTTQATWVLCPESNRYISNLKPDVAMFRRIGAKIAIGTDSLASARSLSMIDNLRQLGDICEVPLTELLIWATYNGAQALGIEGTKGSIKVGKAPGLVIIDGTDLHNLRLTPESTTRRIL